MGTKFVYDPSAVHKKGTEKYIAICKVNSDLTSISGEYFFNVAATEKVSMKHDTGIDEFKSMAGTVINADDGDIKGEMKFTLSQDDANTMNFLMNETSDAYWSFMIHKGAGATGKQEFTYYPKVKISTSYSEDIPGRNVEMNCTPLAAPQPWNANSLTATQNSTTAWLFAGQSTSTVASLSATLSGGLGSYQAFATLTIA